MESVGSNYKRAGQINRKDCIELLGDTSIQRWYKRQEGVSVFSH